MSTLKNIPGVLLQKVLLTALIGIGCLLVGTAYYICARDRVFLALSGLVLLFSLLRSISLYRTITGQKYDIIEGTCVSVSAKPFRNQSRIRILNKEGVETTLCLGKQSKIKIGFRYRFYFKQNQQPTVGSEYFDTALSTDQFLGLEELGKFSFQEKEADLTEHSDFS